MITELEYTLAREVLKPKPRLYSGMKSMPGPWLYAKHRIGRHIAWSFAYALNMERIKEKTEYSGDKIVMLIRLESQGKGLVSLSSRFIQGGYVCLLGHEIHNLKSDLSLSRTAKRFSKNGTGPAARWFTYEHWRALRALELMAKGKEKQ